jgi:hypothetical protein
VSELGVIERGSRRLPTLTVTFQKNTHEHVTKITQRDKIIENTDNVDKSSFEDSVSV